MLYTENKYLIVWKFKDFCVLFIFFFSDEGEEVTFDIYMADASTPGFLDYHERMQMFLLWYIDAASFIDTDDEKWQYFVM